MATVVRCRRNSHLQECTRDHLKDLLFFFAAIYLYMKFPLMAFYVFTRRERLRIGKMNISNLKFLKEKDKQYRLKI